jgi:flagellar biosynthesis protein FlhF
MRLKRVSAPTVAQAIADIRRNFGEDAVIVQIIEPESDGGLFHVVTAFVPVSDTAAPEYFDPHCERLQALRKRLALRPISPIQSIMLIGHPGVGKTLCAVRLALQVNAAGQSVEIISFDGQSAGAMAQLTEFCAPLAIPVRALDFEAAAKITADDNVIRIYDTPGFNSLSRDEILSLAQLIAVSGVEPIWVHGAGMCETEYTRLAKICNAFGVTRKILTRLDLVQDRAAELALVADAQLELAAWADSPFIDAPFLPLTYDYILQDLERAEIIEPEASELQKVA